MRGVLGQSLQLGQHIACGVAIDGQESDALDRERAMQMVYDGTTARHIVGVVKDGVTQEGDVQGRFHGRRLFLKDNRDIPPTVLPRPQR
jgi:hypothetical protein